jgi:hypothetical protein
MSCTLRASRFKVGGRRSGPRYGLQVPGLSGIDVGGQLRRPS